MSNNWKSDNFKCQENWLMCLFAWCVPFGYACMQAFNAKVTTKETNEAIKAFILTWCCCCFGAGYNRQQLRDKFEIQGSYMMDCLCHWCCGCCAVTQEWMEVMERNGKKRGDNICAAADLVK